MCEVTVTRKMSSIKQVIHGLSFYHTGQNIADHNKRLQPNISDICCDKYIPPCSFLYNRGRLMMIAVVNNKIQENLRKTRPLK